MGITPHGKNGIMCYVDVNVPSPMPHGHPIGVDVGLEKFLATSDGVLVKSPKFLKVMQSQLKLLQRRLSRKQKRSKNYEKQRIKVARLHHREVRKDLSVRVHHCPSCNYTTDRDVASGPVIRNRGIKLISTDGQSEIQNAYADGLPGTEETQSRSKSKTRETRLERSRKETTRKSKK